MEQVAKSQEDFFKSMVEDIEGGSSSKVVKQTQEPEYEETEESEDDIFEGDNEGEDESDEVEAEVDSDQEDQEEGSEEEVIEEETEDLLSFEKEESPVSEDLTELAKELGFESVKSKGEVIEEIKRLKELKELQKDVPEDLSEAIKLAKQGGNYLEYLGVATVNYDEYSNRDLVEASMEKYYIVTDAAGQKVIDEDALAEFMDSKSPQEINMLGDNIRDTLKGKQESAKAIYRREAEAKVQEKNSQIKSVLDSVSSIAGVKISDPEKQTLYRDIIQSDLSGAIFKGEDGKANPQKIVENYFKIKYFDKVLQVAKSKSATDGKKDVIKRLTNSNVKTTKKSTSPVSGNKTVSALDSYLQQLKKGL